MKNQHDPIGKLLGLRYKSHPWHGVEIGPDGFVAYKENTAISQMSQRQSWNTLQSIYQSI